MSSLVAYTSSTSGEEEDDSEGAEEVVSHSQVSASTCEGGKDSSSFIDEANAEVTTSIAGQPEAMESTIELEKESDECDKKEKVFDDCKEGPSTLLNSSSLVLEEGPSTKFCILSPTQEVGTVSKVGIGIELRSMAEMDEMTYSSSHNQGDSETFDDARTVATAPVESENSEKGDGYAGELQMQSDAGKDDGLRIESNTEACPSVTECDGAEDPTNTDPIVLEEGCSVEEGFAQTTTDYGTTLNESMASVDAVFMRDNSVTSSVNQHDTKEREEVAMIDGAERGDRDRSCKERLDVSDEQSGRGSREFERREMSLDNRGDSDGGSNGNNTAMGEEASIDQVLGGDEEIFEETEVEDIQLETGRDLQLAEVTEAKASCHESSNSNLTSVSSPIEPVVAYSGEETEVVQPRVFLQPNIYARRHHMKEKACSSETLGSKTAVTVSGDQPGKNEEVEHQKESQVRMENYKGEQVKQDEKKGVGVNRKQGGKEKKEHYLTKELGMDRQKLVEVLQQMLEAKEREEKMKLEQQAGKDKQTNEKDLKSQQSSEAQPVETETYQEGEFYGDGYEGAVYDPESGQYYYPEQQYYQGEDGQYHAYYPDQGYTEQAEGYVGQVEQTNLQYAGKDSEQTVGGDQNQMDRTNQVHEEVMPRDPKQQYTSSEQQYMDPNQRYTEQQQEYSRNPGQSYPEQQYADPNKVDQYYAESDTRNQHFRGHSGQCQEYADSNQQYVDPNDHNHQYANPDQNYGYQNSNEQYGSWGKGEHYEEKHYEQGSYQNYNQDQQMEVEEQGYYKDYKSGYQPVVSSLPSDVPNKSVSFQVKSSSQQSISEASPNTAISMVSPQQPFSNIKVSPEQPSPKMPLAQSAQMAGEPRPLFDPAGETSQMAVEPRPLFEPACEASQHSVSTSLPPQSQQIAPLIQSHSNHMASQNVSSHQVPSGALEGLQHPPAGQLIEQPIQRHPFSHDEFPAPGLQGPPPGNQGPTPSHQGLPPSGQQGPPLGHQGPPPGHQGPLPPSQQGPPIGQPTGQGPPPGHQGPPPPRQQGPPAEQPTGHQGPPPGHQGSLANHHPQYPSSSPSFPSDHSPFQGKHLRPLGEHLPISSSNHPFPGDHPTFSADHPRLPNDGHSFSSSQPSFPGHQAPLHYAHSPHQQDPYPGHQDVPANRPHFVSSQQVPPTSYPEPSHFPDSQDGRSLASHAPVPSHSQWQRPVQGFQHPPSGQMEPPVPSSSKHHEHSRRGDSNDWDRTRRLSKESQGERRWSPFERENRFRDDKAQPIGEERYHRHFQTREGSSSRWSGDRKRDSSRRYRYSLVNEDRHGDSIYVSRNDGRKERFAGSGSRSANDVLKDPRSKKIESDSDRPKSPQHYSKSVKYKAALNYVEKRNSMLRMSVKSKESDKDRGPTLVQPHAEEPLPSSHKKSSDSSQSKKTLSQFKIPKKKGSAMVSTSPVLKHPIAKSDSKVLDLDGYNKTGVSSNQKDSSKEDSLTNNVVSKKQATKDTEAKIADKISEDSKQNSSKADSQIEEVSMQAAKVINEEMANELTLKKEENEEIDSIDLISEFINKRNVEGKKMHMAEGVPNKETSGLSESLDTARDSSSTPAAKAASPTPRSLLAVEVLKHNVAAASTKAAAAEHILTGVTRKGKVGVHSKKSGASFVVVIPTSAISSTANVILPCSVTPTTSSNTTVLAVANTSSTFSCVSTTPSMSTTKSKSSIASTSDDAAPKLSTKSKKKSKENLKPKSKKTVTPTTGKTKVSTTEGKASSTVAATDGNNSSIKPLRGGEDSSTKNMALLGSVSSAKSPSHNWSGLLQRLDPTLVQALAATVQLTLKQATIAERATPVQVATASTTAASSSATSTSTIKTTPTTATLAILPEVAPTPSLPPSSTFPVALPQLTSASTSTSTSDSAPSVSSPSTDDARSSTTQLIATPPTTTFPAHSPVTSSIHTDSSSSTFSSPPNTSVKITLIQDKVARRVSTLRTSTLTARCTSPATSSSGTTPPRPSSRASTPRGTAAGKRSSRSASPTAVGEACSCYSSGVDLSASPDTRSGSPASTVDVRLSTSPQIILSSITPKQSPSILSVPESAVVTATVISAQDALRLRGTHPFGEACADGSTEKLEEDGEHKSCIPLPKSGAPNSAAPQVGLMDLSYHGLYKEYNLRRSRSKTGSPRPGGKVDSTVVATGKRGRSDNNIESTSGEVAAKKMKIDDEVKNPKVSEEAKLKKAEEAMEVEESLGDVEMRECEELQGGVLLKQEAGNDPSEEVAATPRGSPLQPKLSVSRSRKKKKVGAAKKTENLERASTVCALCMKRDSEVNLGFLFGPYKLPQVKEVKKGEKLEGEEKVEASELGGRKSSLWVHESCAVWAPGVCLVGGELLGLHDAVNDGEKLTCRSCKNKGATLCCRSRACKAVYHYPCARDTGCSFMEEQFVILCPKHKLSS